MTDYKVVLRFTIEDAAFRTPTGAATWRREISLPFPPYPGLRIGVVHDPQDRDVFQLFNVGGADADGGHRLVDYDPTTNVFTCEDFRAGIYGTLERTERLMERAGFVRVAE